MVRHRHLFKLIAILFISFILSITSYANEREEKYGTLPPWSVQKKIDSGDYQMPLSEVQGTWKQGENGRWWYEHSDGTYTVDDWEFIGDKWYHFDIDGYRDEGWLLLEGDWYFLEPGHGYMRIEWVYIDEKWYYFDVHGVMQKGWLTLGVKTYYLTPNGDMVTGTQTIDGKEYFFNSSGEKTIKLSYIDTARYFMIDSDISIAGGTVYWNISADVCNESNSKIKVTDRNAYCTYTTISIADPPSFVLGSMPFEYSDMENKKNELIWVKEDSIIPGDSTLVFNVSNHYKENEPSKGNLYFYNRDSDYGLTFAYEYGRSNPVGIVKVVLDSGESYTIPLGWDTRRVNLAYKNVPVDYKFSSENSENKELFNTLDSLKKNAQCFSEPLVSLPRNNQKSTESNASLKEVFVNKILYDIIINNNKILGSSHPEEDAKNLIEKRAILFSEAFNNGFYATDSEINDYEKEITQNYHLDSDPLFLVFANELGGVQGYWDIMKENTRIDLTIEKYLNELKNNFMENKGYEYSTLESENKWQDYLSELISDLKGQYIITFR